MTAVPQQQVVAPPTAPPAQVEREFTVKSRSQSQQALRRFLHNKLAVGAAIVWVLMLVIAFFAFIVMSRGPYR